MTPKSQPNRSARTPPGGAQPPGQVIANQGVGRGFIANISNRANALGIPPHGAERPRQRSGNAVVALQGVYS